jgi:myo-inositol-1(or 4)-monophosphatase
MASSGSSSEFDPDSRMASLKSSPILRPSDSAVSTAPTSPGLSPVDFNTGLAKYGITASMLRKIRDHLVAIARDAGEMMIAADQSIDASETKNNTSDRVTKTDKAIEAMVQTRLTTLYPQFSFLGEETFKMGDKLANAPTFVCDPIDGTLNFIHGFENFAVSLAFCVDKKPVVGVVYNPFRSDLFTAVKNQGAYLTKLDGTPRRLPLRSVLPPMKSLNDCLVAVEWGNQRQGPNWELRTDIAMKLMTAKTAGGAMTHSMRSSGSAALDFCYVAAGMIDAYWEGGIWVWDIAAGWIIVEEAGGIVASANPGDWDPTLEGRLYFPVRAAERAGQEAVVKELWDMMGDRKFEY